MGQGYCLTWPWSSTFESFVGPVIWSAMQTLDIQNGVYPLNMLELANKRILRIVLPLSAVVLSGYGQRL
eukprot:6543041-Ditylum_brightwellii.AAC.1